MKIGWRTLIRKRRRSFHFHPTSYIPIRHYVEDVFESPAQAMAEFRLTQESKHTNQPSNSKKLSSLIRDGHFRMAQATRDEWLSNGRDIGWDDSYFEAAHYALRNHMAQEAIVSFTQWLQLLPNAVRHRDHKENLRRLCDALLKSPQQDIAFIHQFAIVLASKGYTGFVQDYLLPLIKQYGDNEMVHNIKFELLPKTLPSPSTTSDVFEFEHDEYFFESSDVHQVQGDDAVGRLHQCIAKASYEEAKTILSELESVHYPIPPHPIFERGAQLVLEMHQGDRKTRNHNFLLFLSHVPPLHMQASASAIPFHETVQAVIYNHRSLLASVALILSSKGYAAILSPLLLPIILRVNSPESMKEFLKEYEKLNELYHRGTAADQGSNSKQHIPMEMHLMLSKKSIRECAIRALAVIGHLELAVNLIPTMDQEVVLDRRTYGFLLTHLKRRRSLLVEQPIFDPKKLTKVNSFTARVQRIYDEASYGHNATTTEMSLLHGQERFPIVNSELTTTSELANAIRRAKFGLPFNTGRLRESRRFPNQRILFQVISALSSPDVVLTTPSGAQETVALSRPRLLRLLRRRALYSTYVPSKMWLFMEMVYLWRSKRYEAVIKLFGTFFWSFGVPIEEINPIVRLADDLLSMESLPEFFNGNPSKGILPKGKLYPSSEQTSLVWQSLVMVHSGDKVKVVALYKKMMAFARTYHEASKQLHVNAETENPSLDTPYVLPPGLDPEADDSPSLPLVSLEHPLISAETYTPFIAQLSPGRKRPVLRRSDLFPSQIIRDMTTLGLRPTVYHFTELARGYALVGERTKALKVLDHLEAAHPVQASQEDTSELSGSSFEDVTSVNKERKDGLPLPDLVLYIALMRSFIMARDLEGVAEVDGKMKSRYGSMRDMQTRNEKEKVGSVKENLDYLEEVYRDWHSMEVARQLE